MMISELDRNNVRPNGDDLPEDRKAAVAAGLEMYNVIAHERDELRKQNRELRTQIAGLKVAMEAMDSRVIDMESNLVTAKIDRDQAVADRSVYETLFISIQAQLRAFAVPNAPLVKDHSDDNSVALAQLQAVPPTAYDFGSTIGTYPRDRGAVSDTERSPSHSPVSTSILPLGR